MVRNPTLITTSNLQGAKLWVSTKAAQESVGRDSGPISPLYQQQLTMSCFYILCPCRIILKFLQLKPGKVVTAIVWFMTDLRQLAGDL